MFILITTVRSHSYSDRITVCEVCSQHIIDTYHCIIVFGEFNFIIKFVRLCQGHKLLIDIPNLYLGPPNSALGIAGNSCCILVTLVADVFIVRLGTLAKIGTTAL
jgi:hypothetical protein